MKELLERYLKQDWTCHHWPVYQPLEAYRDAEAEYLTRLQRVPGLRAVWKFGEVSVPGVSDLDFVVVLDESVRDTLSHDMVTPQGLSLTGSYIVFHEPFIISQDLFVIWNRWGNGASLTHLCGDDTPPESLSPAEQRFVAAVTLSDLLTQVEPRLFLETLLSGDMHVRATLCQINASRHLVRLYKQITRVSTTPWDSFFAEFEEFRGQWFTLGPERELQLKEYLIQAMAILFELIRTFNETLINQNWFTSQSEGAVLYLAEKFLTVWVTPWSPEYAVQKALELWNCLHQVVVILPTSLALPVLAYTDSNGLISQYVRRNMGPSHVALDGWCDAFQRAAREHVDARNAHVDFLQRKGLFHLEAAYFGLGLWPDYVSKNPLRRYPRRIYYMLRKQRYWHSLNQALKPRA